MLVGGSVEQLVSALADWKAVPTVGEWAEQKAGMMEGKMVAGLVWSRVDEWADWLEEKRVGVKVVSKVGRKAFSMVVKKVVLLEHEKGATMAGPTAVMLVCLKAELMVVWRDLTRVNVMVDPKAGHGLRRRLLARLAGRLT